MFFLKFNDFDKSFSNNDRIRVSSAKFIYNVTIGYDEKSSNRIVLMQDASSLGVKKNDCIIEMNNVQGFIMQDFILFVQIDKKQTGVLNFKNWSTSSNLNAVQATDLTGNPSAGYKYEINILSENPMLHFGDLSFLNNVSKTVNKVNALNLGFYEKGQEKISINDFELAVTNLDLNTNLIYDNQKDQQIKYLSKKLSEALQEIENLRTLFTESCSQTTITFPTTNGTVREIYPLSEQMQNHSFGEAIRFNRGYYLSESYNNQIVTCLLNKHVNSTINLRKSLTINDKQTFDKFYDDFEKRFNIKKENIVLSENHTSKFYTNVALNAGMHDLLEQRAHSPEDQYPMFNRDCTTIQEAKFHENQPSQQYNLSVFNIKKIKDLQYQITIRKSRQNEYTMCGIGEGAVALSLDIAFAYQKNLSFFTDSYGTAYPEYEFIIENVTIKTDKIFKFDGIDQNDYSAEGIRRFIEFEWSVLKKPVLKQYTPEIEKYVAENFPRLSKILGFFQV